MSGTMPVSVVVPAHVGDARLDRCLESLAALHPAPLETIVVSDAGPEDVATIARARGARIVRLERRSGPARARNVGARVARGDIVWFVDADVIVPPNAIARIARAFHEDAGLDALIGSYDAMPTERATVSRFRNLLHHWVHQRGREQASTFWGACGAIRRDRLLALGGFDERYDRPSIEDIELGVRLTRAGGRIRLVKDLLVTHQKRWTLIDFARTDVLRRARPWTLLLLRDGQIPDDLNLRWSGRASVAAAAIGSVTLVGTPWSAPAGALAAASAALLLALNAPLYRFFARRGGLRFAMCAVPLHWLHLWCAAAGLALGVLTHVTHPARRAVGPGKRRAPPLPG